MSIWEHLNPLGKSSFFHEMLHNAMIGQCLHRSWSYEHGSALICIGSFILITNVNGMPQLGHLLFVKWMDPCVWISVMQTWRKRAHLYLIGQKQPHRASTRYENVNNIAHVVKWIERSRQKGKQVLDLVWPPSPFFYMWRGRNACSAGITALIGHFRGPLMTQRENKPFPIQHVGYWFIQWILRLIIKVHSYKEKEMLTSLGKGRGHRWCIRNVYMQREKGTCW